MTRRPWTDAEREEVRRRYPDEVTADIGRDINRSVGGIYDQANKMGLKKSLAFMRVTGGTGSGFIENTGRRPALKAVGGEDAA